MITNALLLSYYCYFAVLEKYLYKTENRALCIPLLINFVCKPLPNSPFKPSLSIISFAAAIYANSPPACSLPTSAVCRTVFKTLKLLDETSDTELAHNPIKADRINCKIRGFNDDNINTC